MFDVDNISKMNGLSVEQIRTFLPNILKTIRNYTHRSFITDVSISGSITIKDNKIIVDSIPDNFVKGSQIELRYSLNNTKIYTIKNIIQNEIETYEKLFDEEFDGFIIRLSFNGIDDDLIASMSSYSETITKQGAIKSETTDGYSYQLNIDGDMFDGYPINILSAISNLRQLPESEKEEYFRYGYYKQC